MRSGAEGPDSGSLIFSRMERSCDVREGAMVVEKYEGKQFEINSECATRSR